jgi:single-stranded DNA-binding protein
LQPSPTPQLQSKPLRRESVEILNQIILAGNLTDQPSVSDAGGRQFVRARLAQSWFYDTQGRTVEHRQFLPITFFGESAIVAKTFQKGGPTLAECPLRMRQ